MGSIRGMLTAAAALVLLITPAWASLPITQFGAVANDASVATSVRNAAAIMAAFAAADKGPDTVVEVPAGQTFYILNASMSGLTDVGFQLSGDLVLNSNQSAWGGAYAALTFTDCAGVTVSGTGTIHGQGYAWWWGVFLGTTSAFGEGRGRAHRRLHARVVRTVRESL